MFGRKIISETIQENDDQQIQHKIVPTILTTEEEHTLVNWLERIAIGDYSLVNSGESPLFAAVANVQNKFLAIATELSYSSGCIEKSSLAMNKRSQEMRDRVSTISSNISEIEELSKSMSLNMSTVASATEELSINMKDISLAALENRDFTGKIATSTASFSESARLIVSNTDRAANVTIQAKKKASETMNRVESLEKATQEIGAVTEAIAEIAEQTKLLALNATIEAARAGVAGRGFAVVAKEVKDLAQQTNNATIDIREKIDAIQEESHRTIEAISSIKEIIEDVASVVDTIAKSSQEQATTFGKLQLMTEQNSISVEQISNNVKMGASAVQDVNLTLADATVISNKVSTAISRISTESASIMSKSVANYALSLECSGQGKFVAELLHDMKLPENVRTIGNTAIPELCRFSSSFSVEVEQFNSDHKVIFQMINEIHKLIKEENTGQQLLQILHKLASFCIEHFDREEIQMRRYNYPDYENHKKIHEELLAKVKSIVTAADNKEELDFIAILSFLKEWLYSHINGVDKKYTPFFHANNLH